MWTTVVGGSTKRAAMRSKTAKDQASAMAMANNRRAARKENFRRGAGRGGAALGVGGGSVTLQNNWLGRWWLDGDVERARLLGHEGDEDGVVLEHAELLLEGVVADGDDAGFGGRAAGGVLQGGDLGAG